MQISPLRAEYRIYLSIYLSIYLLVEVGLLSVVLKPFNLPLFHITSVFKRY